MLTYAEIFGFGGEKWFFRWNIWMLFYYKTTIGFFMLDFVSLTKLSDYDNQSTMDEYSGLSAREFYRRSGNRSSDFTLLEAAFTRSFKLPRGMKFKP